MELEEKKILNRLKRTEGQIRGIQKMIDEEKECIDIITPVSYTHLTLPTNSLV